MVYIFLPLFIIFYGAYPSLRIIKKYNQCLHACTMQIKVLASPEELSYDPLARPTSLKSPTCIERDVQRHTRAMLDRRPVEQ